MLRPFLTLLRPSSFEKSTKFGFLFFVPPLTPIRNCGAYCKILGRKSHCGGCLSEAHATVSLRRRPLRNLKKQRVATNMVLRFSRTTPLEQPLLQRASFRGNLLTPSKLAPLELGLGQGAETPSPLRLKRERREEPSGSPQVMTLHPQGAPGGTRV